MRRIFFTLVPTFTTEEAPLIFKSLMTVTLSPSCKRLPLASLTTSASAGSWGASAALADHSWPHSGQISRLASSYVRVDAQAGQGGKVVISIAFFVVSGWWAGTVVTACRSSHNRPYRARWAGQSP